MYKEVLRTIVGIEIFPVLSLVIFLTVFLVMLVWVLRLDRGRLDAYASLPLEGEGVVTGEAGRRQVAPRGGQL
jgi:cytochrome c oxidase cbb3-type subunit IV